MDLPYPYPFHLGPEAAIMAESLRGAWAMDSVNIDLQNCYGIKALKQNFDFTNVMFEIETRRKANQETLIIVDDIADSFDYQNKYAIIQYLKDNSEDAAGLFKQIIMTHNFDFFRTIQSRLVKYNNCLMASRSATGISLTKAEGIRNIFVKLWKAKFFTETKMKIACIPFLRNLVEYTKGEADPKYQLLTSALHWKAESATLKVSDLDKVYDEICDDTGHSAHDTQLVYDLIMQEAEECMKAMAGANLENKIVLAIAIRLRAERFMVDQINDPEFVKGISENQSNVLSTKFKQMFPNSDKIGILDRVLLMTPENLHLNAFMYEPIIDMSDEALKRLYDDVKKLV